MAKATHTGTCQCCGSTQKLPNGVLSRHGYTLAYGFQHGTCQGAKQAPFEESCDLVKGFIAQAEQAAEEYDEKADVVEKNEEGNIYFYATTSYHSYGPVRKEWVTLTDDEIRFDEEKTESWDGSPGITHIFDRLKKEWAGAGFHGYSTLNSAREKGAKAYASSLRRQAEKMRQYADWQRERIKGWKPTEVTPIEK